MKHKVKQKKSGIKNLYLFHIYDSLEVREGIHLHSNYEFYNKLLGEVTLLRVIPSVT